MSGRLAMRHRTVLLAALVACAALGSRPVIADALPDRTERVIAAGKLWAQLKFFHPYLAYKPIDWDAVLIAALPKLEAATTKDAYKRALGEMLAKLGDPMTRVVDSATTTMAAPTGDWLTTPAPNIVLADLGGFVAGGHDYVGFQTKGQRLVAEAAKAKVLVIDGRAQDAVVASDALEYFLDALPAIDTWPLQRSVEHHGWRTQDGMSSGGYYSMFATTGAQPPKAGPKVGVGHVVFLADARTIIPPAILGLQISGRATLIAPATLTDESVANKIRIDVAGVEVQIRLGELLSGPPTTDVRVPAGELRARGIAVAKTKLAAGQNPKPRAIARLPELLPRNDNDYADKELPSRELRVLAGIRAWAVLDRFFPYRYLIKDWDKALREVLPKLEAATDHDKYLDALRELGARAGDGHIWVWPTKATGPAQGIPPITTRMVEGKLAVQRVLDKTDAKGLAIADVIETIDGKPAIAVIAGKRATTSGSTDDARDQQIASMILWGADASTMKLGVRGADGKLREVELARRSKHIQAMWSSPATPHWKKLPNNIGYVDLKGLTVPEVEPMFKELGETRAIVFDLRGYPKGTAWSIAPRVNVRNAVHGAQFLQPLVFGIGSNEDRQDLRLRFLQPIPPLPAGASIYKGKIVVLIDERAISQSEHTCLFLQETAGATFVGSPTAGANGDVTQMRLPGGLRMSFTGQEVKHLDGKQLQKVGIQPTIRSTPTLAGLRAGKDEVLDRALAFLAAGR